MDLVENNES